MLERGYEIYRVGQVFNFIVLNYTVLNYSAVLNCIITVLNCIISTVLNFSAAVTCRVRNHIGSFGC